jgi:hypothetical protein
MLGLALIVMLFPLKTTCGQVNYTCMPAPDPNGIVQLYYEVEPLGLAFIETLVGGCVSNELKVWYH